MIYLIHIKSPKPNCTGYHSGGHWECVVDSPEHAHQYNTQRGAKGIINALIKRAGLGSQLSEYEIQEFELTRVK